MLPFLGIASFLLLYGAAMKYFIALRLPRQLRYDFVRIHDLAPAASFPDSTGVRAPIPAPEGAVSHYKRGTWPIDAASFEAQTLQLRALGFGDEFDWLRLDDKGVVDTVVARSLQSASHRCDAELTQTFALGQPPTQVFCIFSTYFSDGSSLSTSNRPPYATRYLLRSPRELWQQRPEMDFPTMLREHLETRDRLARERGLQIVSPLEREEVLRVFDAQYQEFRRAVRSKSIVVGLAEAITLRFRPRREWLGAQ